MESRQGSALPLTASICFGDFQMLSNVRPGALRRRRALIARTCSTPSKPRSGSYRACIIAMIDEEYGVQLRGDDIRGAQTIGALYDLVQSRR